MKIYRLLSDAMLDGAKLAEQAFHDLIDGNGRTCALGAAVHAITGHRNVSGCSVIERLFPLLLKVLEVCPVSGCGLYEGEAKYVMILIPHLNDYHQWTREQIAGWLATVEEKLGMVEIVDEKETVLIGTTAPANTRDAEVSSIAL